MTWFLDLIQSPISRIVGGALLIVFGMFIVLNNRSDAPKTEPKAPPQILADRPTDIYEIRFVGRAKNATPDEVLEDVKLASMEDGDEESAVAPYKVDGDDFIVLASPEWYELFKKLHGHKKYLLGFRFHTITLDGHQMSGEHVVMHDPKRSSDASATDDSAKSKDGI